MTTLHQKIDYCLDNINSAMKEMFKSCQVEMDMSYDDEEDYHHFVFLAQDNFSDKRELQDFLHDAFYDMDEFERKELYGSNKFPLMFEMTANGLEDLKQNLKKK